MEWVLECSRQCNCVHAQNGRGGERNVARTNILPIKYNILNFTLQYHENYVFVLFSSNDGIDFFLYWAISVQRTDANANCPCTDTYFVDGINVVVADNECFDNSAMSRVCESDDYAIL